MRMRASFVVKASVVAFIHWKEPVRQSMRAMSYVSHNGLKISVFGFLQGIHTSLSLVKVPNSV